MHLLDLAIEPSMIERTSGLFFKLPSKKLTYNYTVIVKLSDQSYAQTGMHKTTVRPIVTTPFTSTVHEKMNYDKSKKQF